MLKKRREQETVSKRKKERRQLLHRSLKHLKSHHDPLWHQTPTMGIEGLIATIDPKEGLRRAIKMQIEKVRKCTEENPPDGIKIHVWIFFMRNFQPSSNPLLRNAFSFLSSSTCSSSASIV
jgi:hypothetical protein